MKSFLRIFALIIAILAGIMPMAASVFVIPVETEIDLGAFHHFRKALDEAHEKDCDLIVVKLNTFGGALDAADTIRTSLMREILPTVAYVDVNAASAGALIALACDSVYMAPGASMGSATVVNGSGEPMPEKYQSYMSTMMRATAEHHGKVMVGDSMCWRRNPEIAASMVNPEVSVSLTSTQAVECGYADGVAANLTDVLEQLHREDEIVEYYHSTLGDDILGFLSNAAVRAVLIMLILGGIYMEMHTPGLGFAAAVSLVASILYFLPMLVAGGMPGWVLLAFILGIILIALELFVIPGFGICGVCGIIAIIVSMIGAMVNSDSISGVDFEAVGNALIVVGAGGALALIAILFLTSRFGPKFVRRHSELMTELKNSDGFVGVDMGPAKYVGQIAETVTEMRPAGKVSIGSTIFDAVSTGPFILAHRKVMVKKYENAQLYVEEYED